MFWLGPAFCLVWSGCKPFAKIIRWQDLNFKLVVQNNDWQWSCTLILTVFSLYIWILTLSGNLKFGQPLPMPDQIIIMLGLILSKSNWHWINRSREDHQIGQSPNNISRVLTRILKIGVKLLSFGKVWSFTIFVYLDFLKSWSWIKKVGVK